MVCYIGTHCLEGQGQEIYKPGIQQTARDTEDAGSYFGRASQVDQVARSNAFLYGT